MDDLDVPAWSRGGECVLEVDGESVDNGHATMAAKFASDAYKNEQSLVIFVLFGIDGEHDIFGDALECGGVYFTGFGVCEEDLLEGL